MTMINGGVAWHPCLLSDKKVKEKGVARSPGDVKEKAFASAPEAGF